MKTHFSISSISKIVLKGFCVPTSETSCSSHFMETNIFRKKLVSYWAPAQSTRTKMTANGFSSYELFVKIDTFYFTLRLKDHFICENPFVHFQALKICFEGILCSDLRSHPLFLFYGNKHFLKKLVSYLAPAQSQRTKMTANGLSSYKLFVKIDTF